jgi:peptidyl-prolyl cis-trans isomerase SurA
MANSLLRHMLASMLFASSLASSFALHAAPTTLDKVVAIVDSNAILESDIQVAMAAAKQQIAQRKQAVPPDNVLRSEVLRQLILKQAQLERVKRAGVTIDEATLNAAVAEIAKQEGASSLEDFQAKLDAQGAGTYAAARQSIANDLSINRLRQQQVSARIKVSERDIDNFLNSPQGASATTNEVHITHFRVSLPENPSEQQVQAALQLANKVRSSMQASNDVDAISKDNQNDVYRVEGADMGWRKIDVLPEALAIKVNALAANQVSTPIRAADGFHVLKLLERRGSNQKAIVEQYKVRHILIRPSEIVSASDAKQKIDQLYQRAQSGEKFADLASTFSNDPGSGSNGGDLDWVTPGAMVPQFDDVMKKTPAGTISKPFQTQYGWHILTVEDTRQQDMTEQYKRNMARQILAERQFDQEVDSWLREIRAESYVEIKDGTPIN